MSKHKHFHSLKSCQKAYYGGKGGLVPRRPVRQVTCPLNGKPCAAGCPDRYHDAPAGGCFLSTAQSLGVNITRFEGRTVDEP